MRWQDKGKRSRPKLVTYSKETNGQTPNTIPYADFEAAFLTWLDELDCASVIDAADSEEIKSLEEKVAALGFKSHGPIPIVPIMPSAITTSYLL
jgi:hypothetical protein